MRFEEAVDRLAGLPYSWPETGGVLYDLVVDHGLVDLLELGTAHGVATGYMAAAAEETGGRVTTVDLATRLWDPSVESVVEGIGLGHLVTVAREPTSYTWFLKTEIERCSEPDGCRPHYDLCFVDGAKHWTTDGLAFFLVDKLLRSGGWIVFDDLDWTFDRVSGPVSDGISVRTMPPEERSISHVQLIVDLLVRQHPGYEVEAVIEGRLAVARKR